MTPAAALVLGLARSGEAAAAALEARGARVVRADRKLGNDRDPERGAPEGVEVRGLEDSRLLEGVELVVKSPGVPGEAAAVVAARAR
ncbi:MAG: UDP-N-acetylmuramoylalanine--D-glutamate ligase, partial [Gaiellaceae bacterium]|nr:UDP-N-acetylmuramoylalanine--D-glutamate ligase [Gaiellaceae bacterium]